MSQGEYYQIKIKGALGPKWSTYFGELTVTSEQGETTLAGELKDQSALHGLLIKIRDLGLPLLLVKRLDTTGCAQNSRRVPDATSKNEKG